MAGELTGIVFNIQRFSLHDGPGIRTTVFLKGCNVRCAWCHNPESFRTEPQLSVLLSKCTLCGGCAAACKRGVHSIADGTHHMDLGDCILCGSCVDACPAGIISVIGRSQAAEEVMATVLRDRAYYESSGGGVTFSGGEPTVQFDFLIELLKLSRAAGLHVCLETNGLVCQDDLRLVSGFTDLFLFDFKVWDDCLHKKYVGVSNAGVLASLSLLDSLHKQVILRCPIIPGVNDKPEHFAAIKALKQRYPAIVDVEFLPYHVTGISKWKNIGLEYSILDIPSPSKEEEGRWQSLIN